MQDVTTLSTSGKNLNPRRLAFGTMAFVLWRRKLFAEGVYVCFLLCLIIWSLREDFTLQGL